jgi:hypothetical protein
MMCDRNPLVPTSFVPSNLKVEPSSEEDARPENALQPRAR